MKGKIIVIDNTIKETKDLIVKENYILAHTNNVTIGAVKYIQGGQNQADQQNSRLDYGLRL